MATVTFDTLKFLQILENVGIERNQATAFVEIVKESHSSSDVATKEDINNLKNDIALIRSEMRELELRIIIKLGSLIVGTMGLMTAILKLT